MDWRSLNCITHLLQPEIKIILFFLMMVAIFREKSMTFLESWLLYHFWLVQKNDKVLSHDGCRLQKRVWNFWKAGCFIIFGWCKRMIKFFLMMVAVFRKEYEIFGKLVALSFLVGAKGPQCFCRALVSYMLGVTSAPHCIDDVPDKILWKKSKCKCKTR